MPGKFENDSRRSDLSRRVDACLHRRSEGGRTVTSFFSIRDDLIDAGADWIHTEVCIDGPLITSRTPDDLPDFMRAVTRALQ